LPLSLYALCQARLFSLFLIAAVGVPLVPADTWSHNGPLDGYGCHSARKHRRYVCHQGPLAGQGFRSVTEMLEAFKLEENHALAVPRQSVRFSGKVVAVLEGDIIKVMNGNSRVQVRLLGIDSPEQSQRFGKTAKQFTSEMVARRIVTVRTIGINRQGHTLGDVILPDGAVLNRELVKAGMAWRYRKYSTDPILMNLEAEAIAAKRGLWVDPAPIAPWEWRTKQSRGIP
jgi:micrococcal nuclease